MLLCVRVCSQPSATLLSGSVENLDVFQLYTNAGPELDRICGVVFVASLDGAIGMSPRGQHKHHIDL